jgi:hypothetical protein
MWKVAEAGLGVKDDTFIFRQFVYGNRKNLIAGHLLETGVDNSSGVATDRPRSLGEDVWPLWASSRASGKSIRDLYAVSLH